MQAFIRKFGMKVRQYTDISAAYGCHRTLVAIVKEPIIQLPVDIAGGVVSFTHFIGFTNTVTKITKLEQSLAVRLDLWQRQFQSSKRRWIEHAQRRDSGATIVTELFDRQWHKVSRFAPRLVSEHNTGQRRR